MSVIVLALSFISTGVFAGGSGDCILPIGSTTEHLGIGAGFEYNYVSDRNNHLDNNHGADNMEIRDVSQVYGKFLVGLGDNYNLYGKIGTSDYSIKFIDRAQDAKMEVDLYRGLYYGIGLNGLYPVMEMSDVPFGSLTFGVGGDIQTNMSINEVKGLNRSGHGSQGESVDGSFYAIDGENSLYVTCAYDIEQLETSIVPYIGMYHSWMIAGTLEGLDYDTELSGYVNNEDFQAAMDFATFGLVFGTDFDIAKYVSVNLEGRFLGETAFTTGVVLKF
jgi:hypothetical protein